MGLVREPLVSPCLCGCGGISFMGPSSAAVVGVPVASISRRRWAVCVGILVFIKPRGVL